MIHLHPAQAISTARFRWSSEADLQDGIEQLFRIHGCPYRREVQLADGERIDFMVGTIGVEVKIKGAAASVNAQLERYAPHVSELVLVTGRLQLTRMPEQVGGVPLTVVPLVRSLL